MANRNNIQVYQLHNKPFIFMQIRSRPDKLYA